VILEIDTFGGRVDAAVQIRDALLRTDPVRTVAFVNKRAISAGALIGLATQTW
jgi:membrane-bound serine protease (ClpP class)